MPSRYIGLFFLAYLTRLSLQQPTAADWDALNATVNGALIRPTPFARPCFQLANVTGPGSFDVQQCSFVEQNYLNDTTLTGSLGAYINTQWETCQADATGCLLDDIMPNDPLAFTPPRINVSTAADVTAAFQFSKDHGVPIVVRNTGHDYKGRSSGPGSLLLWMHNIQSITLNRAFVPKNCSADIQKPGVTFGAGTQYTSLIDFADLNNITIPSGGDATVAGGGGYLQGGGHSVLTNGFGLAVDRALEFEVVTPTGEHVFANECQFTDLFFALRGGGGGTFGAVLSTTTLALPQLAMNCIQVNINPVREDQGKLIQFMVENTMELAQAGWGGFTTPQTGLIFVNAVLNASEARNSIAPLENFVTQELGGNFRFAVEPSYKAYFVNFPQDVARGTPFVVSSRLVPVDNFSTPEKRAELVSIINATLDEVALPILFQSTPFFFGDKGGTSVTPQWRSSLWHVALTDGWNFNTTIPEIAATYARLSKAVDPLRRITPPGAYQNEADVYEPEFQQSFWGDNYAQLLAIKEKYDPDHLLDCWQCVGWLGPTNQRYRCYLPDNGL
ncbi:FAD-binding domain-containing protein [Gautieria morchelliformis]|nr:FAD-binding domain-containing protein [Gautieria morchelliformis]